MCAGTKCKHERKYKSLSSAVLSKDTENRTVQSFNSQLRYITTLHQENIIFKKCTGLLNNYIKYLSTWSLHEFHI